MEKIKPQTRIILEDQNPYVGITNQRFEVVGPRNESVWVDAGGGGDFFDATDEQKEIIETHGSPVIVYPNGKVESIQQR